MFRDVISRHASPAATPDVDEKGREALVVRVEHMMHAMNDSAVDDEWDAGRDVQKTKEDSSLFFWGCVRENSAGFYDCTLHATATKVWVRGCSGNGVPEAELMVLNMLTCRSRKRTGTGKK